MKAWQVRGAGKPRRHANGGAATSRSGTGSGEDSGIRGRNWIAGFLMCRGTYPLTPPLPFTPGQELAGTVTAVGSGVDLSVGTRVMGVSDFMNGNGSFAGEALALAATVLPVPDAMDDSAAAGFWIPNMTAWIPGWSTEVIFRQANGSYVLGAAGGSGIAAVQLGKALGAEVVAVASDESRAEFCRSYGANHAVVCRNDTVADGRSLAHALRDATEGHGADMIFDPVGGAQGTTAMGALARDGKHLAIGFASGSWPTVDVQMMTLTNTSLVGVLAAGYSQEHIDGILQSLTTMMNRGQLRGSVLEKVPFDEVPEALTRVAAERRAGSASWKSVAHK